MPSGLRTTPNNSFQTHPRNRGWVSNLLNSGPIEPLKGIGELDNVMIIILFPFLAYLEERYRGVTGLPLKYPYFMGKEHGFRSTIESFWLHLSTIEDLTKLKSHQKDREFLKIWLNNSKSSTSLGKNPWEKPWKATVLVPLSRCRVSPWSGDGLTCELTAEGEVPDDAWGPQRSVGKDLQRIFPWVFPWFSHEI